MNPHTTTEEKVSISEASRRMKRSRSTLHAWIRKGLPVHAGGKVSISEVQTFAALKRQGPHAPHLLKLARESKPNTADPVTVQRTELEAVLRQLEGGEGATGLLARLRHVERTAFKLLADAQRAGDPAAEGLRGRLHTDAAAAMLRCENLIDQRKEIEAAVYGEFERAYTDWAAPVRAVLDQMPRSLASRCNAADPPHAEVVLREWVQQFYVFLNAKPQTETEGAHEEKTAARPS